MIDNKKILVIIPARGGSKRFPGKNIHPLMGKPLISYPIEASKGSKYVDKIVISTDSEEIADVGRKYGGEVPFMRPEELASDASRVIDSIDYTVKKLEADSGFHADYVVLLQAASPLMSTDNIDKAIELIVEKDADSVVGVAEVDNLNHPYNVREVYEDGRINFWQEELHYKHYNAPKPKFYHAGSLWVSSYNTICNDHKLEGKNNYPLIVERWQLADIDYKEDLTLIESIIKSNNYGKQ